LEEENEMLRNQKETYMKEGQKLREEKQILKKESESPKYQCDGCDHKAKTQGGLRTHQQAQHYSDQNHQVDLNYLLNRDLKFIEYSCHYCCKRIKSKDELEEHKPVCYTIKDFALYPCDECGAKSQEEADLGHHRTTYHELGTFSNKHGVEIFWCDVCPITFRSKENLNDHIGVCHSGNY